MSNAKKFLARRGSLKLTSAANLAKAKFLACVSLKNYTLGPVFERRKEFSSALQSTLSTKLVAPKRDGSGYHRIFKTVIKTVTYRVEISLTLRFQSQCTGNCGLLLLLLESDSNKF